MNDGLDKLEMKILDKSVDTLSQSVVDLRKENAELKDLLRLAHEDAVKLAKDLQGALIV
tara:strand:+ start:1094 stop:1270 length:177 start_codon:yes stop_codon:yes gene_type:complete